MKIVSIVGARPQFIKAAVVSRQLRARPDCQELLIHTGQHYDANMSEVFFEEMEIPRPDFTLNVGSGPHGEQTGKMLSAIERVLLEHQPDWVLVYGDTNSTLAGALAAAKLHIPIAHVEAGLRSFNRQMPEELNRILTDHVSSLLFAPTETAVRNLHREGMSDDAIHLVGDVMYDATIFYGGLAEKKSEVLAKTDVRPATYVLATIHRAENTDHSSRLRHIFDAFAELAKHTTVVIPLHPRTRNALRREGRYDFANSSLRIIDPVGYLDMLMLERNASLIVTDSGGVQKEAYFCGVPCATLRTETEWTELLDTGWNQLVDPCAGEQIASSLVELLHAPSPEQLHSHGFGEGQAAASITSELAVARRKAAAPSRLCA